MLIGISHLVIYVMGLSKGGGDMSKGGFVQGFFLSKGLLERGDWKGGLEGGHMSCYPVSTGTSFLDLSQMCVFSLSLLLLGHGCMMTTKRRQLYD